MTTPWRRVRLWQQTRGRRAVSTSFLRGAGIEIGALHSPLPLGPQARVRYVDRMDHDALRRHYPELQNQPLVTVDIIDNGETLHSFPDATLDFIIASHMLEHCENPIGTVRSHLRKLRPGGILYYGIPNKNKSFDARRPLTPFSHLLEDDRNGPETSRLAHYQEFAALVQNISAPDVPAHARHLQDSGYSIHFHVWDVPAFRDFLDQTNTCLSSPFKTVHFGPNVSEIIAVLRKQ